MTNEVCVCGRTNNKPHCSECGSMNVYSKRINNVEVISSLDGNLLKPGIYRGFKCRRCGADFSFGLSVCSAPKLLSPIEKLEARRNNNTNVREEELKPLADVILTAKGPERLTAIAELLKKTEPKTEKEIQNK